MRRLANLWVSAPYRPANKAASAEIRSQNQHQTLIFKDQIRSFQQIYPTPLGTLLGHFAKANPHWRLLDTGGDSLAIFHGPHAYISPSWYSGHAPAVPTWNYAVAHAYGIAETRTDLGWLDALLDRMVAVYESALPSRGAMSCPRNCVNN